jgi:hypothetical protein
MLVCNGLKGLPDAVMPSGRRRSCRPEPSISPGNSFMYPQNAAGAASPDSDLVPSVRRDYSIVGREIFLLHKGQMQRVRITFYGPVRCLSLTGRNSAAGIVIKFGKPAWRVSASLVPSGRASRPCWWSVIIGLADAARLPRTGADHSATTNCDGRAIGAIPVLSRERLVLMRVFWRNG